MCRLLCLALCRLQDPNSGPHLYMLCGFFFSLPPPPLALCESMQVHIEAGVTVRCLPQPLFALVSSLNRKLTDWLTSPGTFLSLPPTLRSQVHAAAVHFLAWALGIRHGYGCLNNTHYNSLSISQLCLFSCTSVASSLPIMPHCFWTCKG